MPRKLLRRLLPKPVALRKQKLFQFFGHWLDDPDLWHLSRIPVAKGVAIGIFCAYLPIPIQTLIAILMAIVFRGNLLASAGLVWISNPVTFPFIFGTAYLLGVKITEYFDLFSFIFLMNAPSWVEKYLQTFIGCLIIGPAFAFCGFHIVSQLWRLHVITRWKNRKHFRLKNNGQSIL